VLLLTMAGLIGLFWPELLENSWVMYAVQSLPQYLIAMPIAVLMLRHMPHPQKEKKRLQPKQLAVIFLICYFIMYIGGLVGTAVTSIIEVAVNGEMIDFLSEMIEGSDIWATVVAVVILAPIAEELFFRKLVIDRLDVYGERAAVIVSALIFGLVHGNLTQFFYAFGLGLAFGYVYIKTRRIKYTIILHMLVNLLGSVVTLLALENDDMAAIFGFVVLGMVAAGLVLFIKNKKRIILLPERGVQRWASPAFFNVGMILFFVVSLIVFVFNTVNAFV